MADLRAQVSTKIAEMAPYLDRSGAHIELLGVEDGVAQIDLRLTRPGSSRLVASLQLKSGIERALKDAIPGLRGVEALNLPPFALLGWDQPVPRPVDPPVTDAPPKA